MKSNNKPYKMETTTVTAKTKWLMDQAHSEISFKVRHLIIAHVKGGFRRSVQRSARCAVVPAMCLCVNHVTYSGSCVTHSGNYKQTFAL